MQVAQKYSHLYFTPTFNTFTWDTKNFYLLIKDGGGKEAYFEAKHHFHRSWAKLK